MHSLPHDLMASTLQIPVVAKLCLWVQKNPSVKFEPGPFYMGKIGYFVNIYAVLWCVIFVQQGFGLKNDEKRTVYL